MNSRDRAIAGVSLALAAGVSFVLLSGTRGPLAAGEKLQRAGDLEGAYRIWDAACNAEPPHAEACASSGGTRLFHGEVDEARPFIERAALADPKGLRVLLLLGAQAQSEGRDEDALRIYGEAETLHPASGLPASNLGMLALAREDVSSAEAAALRAIATEPGLWLGWTLRARVETLKEDDAAAEAAYREVLRLAPEAFEERLELADLLNLQDRLDESAAILQRAAELRPDDSGVHFALGETLHRLDHVDEAIVALRRASELAPDRPEPHVLLGEIFLRQGNDTFALARFQEVLKLDPKNVDARQMLAHVHRRQRDPSAALAILDVLLGEKSLSSEDAVNARFLRAQIHAEERQAGKAHADLAEVLAMQPAFRAAHQLEGHLLLEEKKYDLAKPHLEVALGTDASQADPGALLDHARLLAHLGRRDDAIAELKMLSARQEFEADQVRAQPEFSGLSKEPEFLMLLDSAANRP